eukprot:scaffold7786_cov159-Amphora_coffeaeformis.AAC.1
MAVFDASRASARAFYLRGQHRMTMPKTTTTTTTSSSSSTTPPPPPQQQTQKYYPDMNSTFTIQQIEYWQWPSPQQGRVDENLIEH